MATIFPQILSREATIMLLCSACTVSGVTHVINHELPNEPESYVHRIGRTAPAQAGGLTAI